MARSHDGREFMETFAIQGEYDFPSYSTIAGVVEFCRVRGVPTEHWPIYYGFDDEDIPLVEVRSRCEALMAGLAKLRPEEIGQHWWLERVRGWLANGEMFCVTE